MDKTHTIEGFATAFREALAGGIERAAKVYVEYEDAGVDMVKAAAAVNCTRQVFALVADIGHGRLLPDALLAGPDAVRALRPYDLETQRRLLNEGVELLASDGSPLKVRIGDMTSEQRVQLMPYSGGIRTIGEQRAYLEARRNEAETRAAPRRAAATPVDIHRGYVVFSASDVPRKYTTEELLSLAQRSM